MTDITTPAPTPRAKRPRSRPAGPPQQQRTREVHPVLEKLFELYPKMFGARFLPLKLGAFQDLMAENPEAFKKDELKVALGLHARSTRYLECVAAGLPRHNLQGEPIEPVAPEHVHHAIMEVFRRRQARSKEDLRPKVRAQLIAAIEASGLSREAYAERIRTQDEAAVALLDEAFAEMAMQTAKREALMRAFEASGKTVEQFAEMYGMAPADVAEAVERTRQAGAAQPQ
jgi:ProP effector